MTDYDFCFGEMTLIDYQELKELIIQANYAQPKDIFDVMKVMDVSERSIRLINKYCTVDVLSLPVEELPNVSRQFAEQFVDFLESISASKPYG